MEAAVSTRAAPFPKRRTASTLRVATALAALERGERSVIAPALLVVVIILLTLLTAAAPVEGEMLQLIRSRSLVLIRGAPFSLALNTTTACIRPCEATTFVAATVNVTRLEGPAGGAGSTGGAGMGGASTGCEGAGPESKGGGCAFGAEGSNGGGCCWGGRGGNISSGGEGEDGPNNGVDSGLVSDSGVNFGGFT